MGDTPERRTNRRSGWRWIIVDERCCQYPTGGSLPPEYQQVEYLQSTGTQYIDTLVKSTTTLELDITLAVNSLTGDQKFFGAYISGNNGICLGLLNSKWRIGGGFWGGNDVSASLDITNIKASGTTWTINGVTTTSTTSIGINNNTILCFATRYSSSTIYSGSSIKVYNLKLFNDSSLVRNFIPCYRKSDNEPGMYDIINNVFYTNAGTGTFIVGNDIN